MKKRPITLKSSISQITAEDERALIVALTSLIEVLAKQELQLSQTVTSNVEVKNGTGLEELPHLKSPPVAGKEFTNE